MMYTISCEATFDAAHSLPLLPKDHKCHGVHGHSYRVIVELTGELNEHGFVEDYGMVREVLNEILYKLDHKNLNDLFDQPSTEIIAEYIFEQMVNEFEKMSAVTIYETPSNSCRYAP